MDEMNNNPDNWKAWGIIYFNPKDKRLLVPKKNLNGLTLNFAHPLSILIAAGLILIIGFTIRHGQ